MSHAAPVPLWHLRCWLAVDVADGGVKVPKAGGCVDLDVVTPDQLLWGELVTVSTLTPICSRLAYNPLDCPYKMMIGINMNCGRNLVQ